MPQQTIDIGSAPNDGTGDTLRDAGDKINDNFTELYGFSGGGNAIQQGPHTIPIVAAAMVPNTTNGAVAGTLETSSNDVMLRTLDFDKDTDEFAQVAIPMPESWDEGTILAQFLWTAGTTGDVVWTCAAVALSDSDPLDAAFGTPQSVTDSVTSADELMISAFTSAITVGGSAAPKDLVVFRFSRDANNGSDNLAADARLIAVRLIYTIDAEDDS